jgi:hypothetical protein
VAAAIILLLAAGTFSIGYLSRCMAVIAAVQTNRDKRRRCVKTHFRIDKAAVKSAG